MSAYGGFRPYVSVAQKQAKAAKKLAQLRRGDPSITPVVHKSGKLAQTWWGKAWNKNLESYADFESRIGRGKSYVKNGMVLDLRISEGLVRGLVMGSKASPYEVAIRIDTLPDVKWKKITSSFSNKIGSVSELAEGTFPQGLADSFLSQKEGLFPSPREIHFSCSCPDWADMCKHVSAVLYGVGARFDEDPLLFFKLRSIPFEELLKKSVDEKMESLLKNVNAPSSRILIEEDVAGLFGL